MKKRIICMLLAVTMLVSLLPVSAWADTQPWEAAEYTYDPALVAEIQKICDEQELTYDAVDVLNALQQSGVIDRKGDLKLSGTFTVVEDNVETQMDRETLAETALLRESTAELTLDGVVMTWGDVAKLINMMDALAAIQTCLESEETLSDAHIANIKSFYEALQGGNLRFGGSESGDPTKRVYLREKEGSWEFCTVKDGELVADNTGTATDSQKALMKIQKWVSTDPSTKKRTYADQYTYGTSYTAAELNDLASCTHIEDDICETMNAKADGYSYCAMDIDIAAADFTTQQTPALPAVNTYEKNKYADGITFVDYDDQSEDPDIVDYKSHKLLEGSGKADCSASKVSSTVTKNTNGLTKDDYVSCYVTHISIPISSLGITGDSKDERTFCVWLRGLTGGNEQFFEDTDVADLTLTLKGKSSVQDKTFPTDGGYYTVRGTGKLTFTSSEYDLKEKYNTIEINVVKAYAMNANELQKTLHFLNNWYHHDELTANLYTQINGIPVVTKSENRSYFNNTYTYMESYKLGDVWYARNAQNYYDSDEGVENITVCVPGGGYQVESITADSGSFLPGDKVRIYLTLDHMAKAKDFAEKAYIVVNGDTLTPIVGDSNKEKLTKTLVFEYTVKADDAAYPVLQSMGTTAALQHDCGLTDDTVGFKLDSTVDAFKGVALGSGSGQGYAIKTGKNGDPVAFCTPLKTDALTAGTVYKDDKGAAKELQIPLTGATDAETKNIWRWVCIDTVTLQDGSEPYLRSMYAKIGASGEKLPVKVKLKSESFTYTTLSGATVNANERPEYLYVELPNNSESIYQMAGVHLYVNNGFDSEDYSTGDKTLDEATAYTPTAFYPVLFTPSILLTADDITLVYNDAWTDYANIYAPDIATETSKSVRAMRLDEYLESGKTLKLSYELGTAQTFTFVEGEQFLWVSSDEEIATVATTMEDYTWGGKNVKRAVATVTPVTYGTVYFTLYALNGKDAETANTEELVAVDSAALTITDAPDPYMTVPATSKVVKTHPGVDTKVVFNTNISRRNAEQYKQDETTITLTLYKAEQTLDGVKKTGDAIGDPVCVTATYDAPVYSIAIPGDRITEISPDGGVTYIAEISADSWENPEKFAAKTPKTYTDTAFIAVEEGPISVVFDSDTNNAVSNAQPYELSWNWASVNPDSVNKCWYYEVVDADTGETLIGTSDKKSTDFTVSSVSIPVDTLNLDTRSTALKNTYIITVYAANDPALGYSAQSVLLYAYNASAIDILVKDIEKYTDGLTSVDKSGGEDTIRLDHRSWVESHLCGDGKTLDIDGCHLSVAELRHDLQLAGIVSMRFGSYTWSLVSDQIQWKVTDTGDVDDAANLYLYKGGLYSDIDNFSYPSYLPIEEFLLSAERDGSVQLEATHAKSGISTTVDVTVDDMEGELFFFDFYPLMPVSVLYTNGKGKKVTVTSNEEGVLAFYEKDGIKAGSELYFSGTDKSGVEYLGLTTQEALKSGEANVLSGGGTYPKNSFVLTPKGQADIYLLRPDGTPLANTAVTVRGGVYRNGTYCKKADLYHDSKCAEDPNDNANLSNGIAGDTFTTDKNGKITVYFNPDQIYDTEEERRFGSVGSIIYAFELTFANDAYEPVIFEMDAKSTEATSRFVNRVVNLTGHGSADAKTPYLCQTWNEAFKNGQSIGRTELRGDEKYVGPNSVYTRMDISPTLALWNRTDLVTNDGTAPAKLASNQLTMQYYKENGNPIPSQTNKAFVYEFSTIPLVKNTFKGDANAFRGWLTANESEPVKLELRDGSQTVWSLKPSYSIINDIGTENPKNSAEMEDLAKKATKSVGEAMDIDTLLRDKIPGGDMLYEGMTFFTGVSMAGPPFDLLLLPTGDPTQFDVVISIGENGAKDVSFEFDDSFDTDALIEAALNDATDKTDELFSFYGSIVARAGYDPDDGTWTLTMREGTIGARFEAKYEYGENFFVGPVPVNIEFEAGAGIGAEISPSFHAGPNEDEQAVLASILVNAYIEAFAGLGFDASIVALKIGITGRLSLGFTFKTLMGDPGFSHGEKLDLDGMIGIKLVAKLLFISYSKTFASVSFHKDWKWNEYNAIEQYWNGTTKSGNPYTAVLQGGKLNMMVSSAPKRMLLSAISGNNLLTASNLTGNEEPVLSDDGSIVVYLDDGVACWAKLEGSAYVPQGPIDAVGKKIDGTFEPGENDFYGDYYIDVAGTAATGYTAVWVRQMEELEKEKSDASEPGQDDLRVAMNSTEVYAAVYKDSQWTIARFTENSNPDLAPKAAVGGGKAIVAWRSVFNSGDDLMAFDVNNDLCYRIFDGADWSATAKAYNGASGTVMALDTALSADSAIIAYTVDTGAETGSGLETFYTFIKDGETQTVRATTNNYTDENVKLAAVKRGDADQYILAWYSDNGENADVNLLAVNADGTVDGTFPESVSQLEALDITNGFELAAAPGGGVDTLVVTWTRFSSEGTDSQGAEKEQYTTVYGAKFYEADGSVGVTPRQIVKETGSYITVGDYCAYAEGNTVKALLVESDYSDGAATVIDEVNVDELLSHIVKEEDFESEEAYNAEIKKYKDAIAADTDGGYKKTIAILAAEPKAKLELCTYAFVNKLTVSAEAMSGDIIPGLDTILSFRLSNDGITPLTNVTVKHGDDTAASVSVLNPGESTELFVTYKVPTDLSAMDYDYTVSVDNADVSDIPGTIVLNNPEIRIADAKIVSAANAKRRVNVQLANAGFIDIAGNGSKTVKVGIYQDADCAGTPIATKTITEQDQLSLVDAGAGIAAFELNMQSVMGANNEIPEDGLTLYARAEIKDGPETVASRKRSFTVSPMAYEPLTVSYVSNVDETSCDVDVTVTNNTLNNKTIENLMVTLYDKDGKVIAQKITYNGTQASYFTVNAESSVNKEISVELPDGVKAKDVVRTEVKATNAKINYQFVYNIEDGNHDTPISSGNLTIGGKINQISDPTFEEHDFLGWYSDIYCTEEYDFNSVPFEDVTLYAKWSSPLELTAKNGAILLSPANPLPGQTITMRFRADEGYEFSSVSLTQPKELDPQIELEETAPGKYTFVMPELTDDQTMTLTAQFNSVSQGISFGGGGSGDSVSVSGNGGSIEATVSVSGTTAKVKQISDAELSEITGSEAVEIDLTALDREIDSLVLPTANANKFGKMGGMKVMLTTGTVTFDKSAMQEITAQAKGNTVEFRVEITQTSKFNSAQRRAVEELDTALVLNISALSDSKELCTEVLRGFNGGKATVCVPFAVPEGRTAAEYSVYYVSESGKLERLAARFDAEKQGFVFELTHLSKYVIAYTRNVSPFTDVLPGDYFYDAVLWAAENDITKGTSDTTFSPGNPVTRGQVVTFLWRAAGEPEPTGEAVAFTDVPANAYYAKAVAWAVEQGITKGTGDTTFSPETVCTRGQIVTFLARFAGVEDAETESVFDDVNAADYFAAAVKWAKENGVTEGTTPTTFGPNEDCTRGQVVTFLWRWMVK